MSTSLEVKIRKNIFSHQQTQTQQLQKQICSNFQKKINQKHTPKATDNSHKTLLQPKPNQTITNKKHYNINTKGKKYVSQELQVIPTEHKVI